MTPVYFALDLSDAPDAISAYKAWHAPGAVPAAVTQSIRDAGIDALEIFLVGNRLIMVLIPGPNFDAAKKAAADATNPAVQAWEDLMWTFQRALPFAGPGEKWMRMERIYALSEQA